jgi:hypothetical protein
MEIYRSIEPAASTVSGKQEKLKRSPPERAGDREAQRFF